MYIAESCTFPFGNLAALICTNAANDSCMMIVVTDF